MLKRVRKGLVVWGAIIVAIGFVTISLFRYSGGAALIVPIILILGGGIMLVFGILNIVKTTKYNNQIASQHGSFSGTCPYCGAQMNCTIRDFRVHGRFPEGFVYCRVCKQPVSKNAFQENIPNQSGAM